MDWIYNDYEVKNRLNNIMWTISGIYDEELENLDDYAKLSKELSIYYAIKAGARKKYVDWTLIKKYVAYKINRGALRNHILSFAEICIDIMVEEKMLAERPGVKEIRNFAYNLLLEKFLRKNMLDDLEKVKHALIFEQMGKSVMFDGKTLRILQDIKESAYAQDTKDLIRLIDFFYNKYFSDTIHDDAYENDALMEQVQVMVEDREENEFSEFLYEELFKDVQVDADISEAVHQLSTSLIIESLGEWQDEKKHNDQRVIYVDEEMAKQIYEKIEYYYGKSMLSYDEVKSVERKISRGIHEGCRVHFTDGVLRTDCQNLFQIKYVTRQKENNLSFYGQNPKINKRNIVKLKQTIMQTMVAENEITAVPSDHGKIAANKLWRVGRSINTKVFQKIINNEKGGYVVDILLDASGSQRMHQGNVATQAYIISEALTLSGIPNRVLGFNSFLDYTILRRYRDYHSSVEENQNIFEYYAAGNNRDGLALRAVGEGLTKRQEENKILIVLSDGKPNDIKISKNNQRVLKGEIPYKGIAAIKNTALEVRQLRSQGIMVLGVFTGKEEDLYAEKFIYGKDFIFIRNIDRFSDIVGTFIKRVIENY
ncbi:MAG: nitric oxide reductase activation-like protein [Eubacteriales bacterium]